MPKKSLDTKRPIKSHPLVTNLCPDPEDQPDLVWLHGYIGPAQKQGYVRVYHGLDFFSYTEVPEDAICRVEPTDPKNENRPADVVISAHTEVKRVQRTVQTGESDFLTGGASTQLTGAARTKGGCSGETLLPPPQTDCCPDTVDVVTVPPKCPAPPPKKPKNPPSTGARC